MWIRSPRNRAGYDSVSLNRLKFLIKERNFRQGEDEELYDYFKKYALEFFRALGLPGERLRYHDHEKLAHYISRNTQLGF